MRRVREILLALFFFLTVFSLIFHKALFGGFVWYRRDLAAYFIPVWDFGVQSVKSGAFPLWNPYVFGGTSFFAHIQSCVLYPPTLIFYPAGVVAGLNAYLVFHLVLAAVFTYAWARHAGLGRAAAVLGGLAYALGGTMTGILNNPIILCSAAWFPLVLLCFSRLKERLSLGNAVLCSFSLLAAALAGDPAAAFAAAFAVLCLSAGSVRSLAAAAAAVALCALLGAFQFLPFFEKIAGSTRAGSAFADATVWSVAPRDLAGLLLPDWPAFGAAAGGYWERQSLFGNYYLGASTAVLALFGAFRIKEKNARSAAFLLVLGLALACGRFTPLYRLFYEIVPLASHVRYPARFLFLAGFGAAALAAYGLDSTLRSARPDKRRAVIAFGVCAAAGAASFWAGEAGPAAASVRISLFGLQAAAAAGFVFYSSFRIPVRALAAFFLLAAAADLASANAGREPLIERAVMTAAPPTVQKLRDKTGLFRVLPSEPRADVNDELAFLMRLDALMPNTNMLHRIETMAGYDAFHDSEMDYSVIQLKRKDPELENALTDAANIRYLVSPDRTILINPEVLPRAALFDDAIAVEDAASAVACLKREGHDVSKTLCVESPAAARTAQHAAVSDGAESVEVLYPDANSARVDVRAASAKWLYLADRFDKNWRCEVSGEPSEIFRANLLFRAVRVPAGTSRVEFRYDPVSVRLGFAVSAAALFAVAAAVGYTLVMKRRNHPAVSRPAGFTLIELAMVMVILGVLAATAVTLYSNITRSAREGAVRGKLGAIRSAVHLFYAQQATTGTARFPANTAELAAMFPDGQIPRNDLVYATWNPQLGISGRLTNFKPPVVALPGDGLDYWTSSDPAWFVDTVTGRVGAYVDTEDSNPRNW